MLGDELYGRAGEALLHQIPLPGQLTLPRGRHHCIARSVADSCYALGVYFVGLGCNL